MATNNVKKLVNLNSIKVALEYAHDDLHNKKALGKDDFDSQGLSEQAFDQWCDYVNGLRDLAIDYIKLTEDINAEPKQIAKAKSAVFNEWRAVLKKGTEEEFNPGFFIRKEDAEKIGHWACFTTIDTAHGRVAAAQGKAEFRKRIETLIGIRMAGNAMLDDETRDVIVNYESAVKTEKRLMDVLNGYDKAKDHFDGLTEQLSAKQAILAKMEQQAVKYKMTEEDAADFLKGIKGQIDDLEKAIADTNKSIEEAQKTQKKLKEQYTDLIAKLKMIGDR